MSVPYHQPILVQPKELDDIFQVRHQHILATRKIPRGLRKVFGRYIDHTPGLGAEQQKRADQRRREVYEEYDVDSVVFDSADYFDLTEVTRMATVGMAATTLETLAMHATPAERAPRRRLARLTPPVLRIILGGELRTAQNQPAAVLGDYARRHALEQRALRRAPVKLVS